MNTFIADDGERLHLRITGNGTPLILLHGWTSSHTVWNPLLETLQLHHRVFCPDARGHGCHALVVTHEPDVGRLARDVLNLMDHFGLERAGVAGHSMGALTLWQFIRNYGCGRFSHLCIIDQSPKLITEAGWANGICGDFDAARSQRLLDDLDSDFVETVLRLIAYGLNAKARETYERDSRGWQQSRQFLRKLAPGPLIAIWKSLVTADFRDVQQHIDVPTLLVWGAESNFYTLEAARFLLDQIRTARLQTYEGSDHSPQLQQPERFARELVAFVVEGSVAGDAALANGSCAA
jgi:pimeloyl-ACP methyl ester carboxylesterase